MSVAMGRIRMELSESDLKKMPYIQN